MDTLIPEQTQGVQAWDRYAYANNSPIKITDPTGHKGYNPNKNEPNLPDASLISISGTFGLGPWYYSVGLDIVITDNEIGVFNITSAGPGSGGGEISGAHTTDDSAWISPQVGLSLLGGVVENDQLRNDVMNYEGDVLLFGASGGEVLGFGVEGFSSVDDNSGKADFKTTGGACGLSISMIPIPAEAHAMIAHAEYNDFWSNIFSNLFFGSR